MRFTDRNLTIITGVCLAVGMGVAGFFLRDNATVSGFAQANAAASPALPPLVSGADTSIPAHMPVSENQVILASMPQLAQIGPPSNVRPVPIATAAALCQIKVSAQARIAAQVLLTINAPCQPSTTVTIHHGGLSFREKLSAEGVLSLIIPAFSEVAKFDVDLNDGQQKTAMAMVPEAARINRIAISWQGKHDIELLAVDRESHRISPENPRSLRQALLDNGGYVTVLGNPDLQAPIRAQVITFFQASKQIKTVPVMLKLTGCMPDFTIQTVRVQPNIGRFSSRLRLDATHCGKGTGNVVLNKVLESMTIALR